MRAFTRRRFWIALRYRLGVLGVCLAYLLAALEFPLPVFIHKPSGQPFPCQNHLCGCQTAEQCWSHCCCFSPEERWVWAREHNVEPPAYAERPADKPASDGWNTVKLRDRDESAKACCCCAPKAAVPAREEPPLASAPVKWVTTIAALRCQGYSTQWVSTGAVTLVSPLAAWSPESVPPSRVYLLSLRADIVPSTPPDPPPRLSLV